MKHVLKRRTHGRLFFEGWSISDPEHEELHEALHTARYALQQLTQQQAYTVLAAAEAYIHLTTHPAGVSKMVDKLRSICRVIR